MQNDVNFGPFTLSPSRRALLRHGRVVPLGSRAVDILMFLAAHPGEVKTNAEIFRHVWPDTFVEEANLRVHISALRKALQDTQGEPRFIANVPGRGYVFLAADTVTVAPHEPTRPHRIFGRDDVIDGLAAQLEVGRLVTLVGPGGIGKSTVARAVAGRLSRVLQTIWIDLSEVGHAGLVQGAVAGALGLPSRDADVVTELARSLAARDVLLVLDGCEHVIDAVASLVEVTTQAAPRLRVLATSREPLRVLGERVHRLPPLPPPRLESDWDAVLQSPAAQLFLERADACLGGYRLDEADAPHVAAICTRLDGIPLAIELAAARLETISVPALAASLNDCFRLLTRGRRTALARHRTLRATLDWSYAILPDREQRALARLSALGGWFDARTARAVLPSGDAEDDLAALVAKSLVVAEASPRRTLYRLLDTTRLYAAEKLDATDRLTAIAGLAAELAARFETAETELYTLGPADWSEDHAVTVPDVRQALDWAFSPAGDTVLGVRLTVACLPLFYRLSLLDECLAAVIRAIAVLEAAPGLDERCRMKLHAALGWPQMRALAAAEHGAEAWRTALTIAESLGDLDHQLRSVWALWVDAINRADPRLGLDFAERFVALAQTSPNPTDAVVGRRLRGATLHWLGQHGAAEAELRRMLLDYGAGDRLGDTVRFQFDQRLMARVILARVEWFLGREAEALASVAAMIDEAEALDHTLSLANVLAEAACPIALLAGRNDLAAEYVARLRATTRALSLDVWHCYADCFEAELHLRQGDAAACLRDLEPALETLRSANFRLFLSMFEATAAAALERCDRPGEALHILDAAIAQCGRSGERWFLPELLRQRAMLTLRQAGDGTRDDSADRLRQALAEARADGAVAWERRIEADLTMLRAGPSNLVALSSLRSSRAAAPGRGGPICSD